MRGEVGKETPKKEMDFYDVTRNILASLQTCSLFENLLIQKSLYIYNLLTFVQEGARKILGCVFTYIQYSLYMYLNNWRGEGVALKSPMFLCRNVRPALGSN